MLCLSDYRSTEGHTYHPNATLHTYDYAIRQVVRLIATHYSYHQASTGSHRGRKIKKEIKKGLMSVNQVVFLIREVKIAHHI